MTRIFGLLTLAAAIFAFSTTASHACGLNWRELREVHSDNHHYFVHAGNCSRSITLVRACTCPDEAEILAQEYRDRDYRLVWIKTTPETYGG